ncbi:hypothetical protein BDZ94DRAFT_1263022 [Collybia nuda]|uniref:Uncharacterized protein n=1 Tax=Collybia nuda TaxID=64659 RepID=A0A9P6CH10_9AGAR|nr:hypothetical protein BDZ94DRAFT_1263022 [Collybia nuda]
MCINLTPSYVDKLLCLQNLRTLRVLAIAPPETTSNFLQSISALPRLEELHLILLEGAVINRIPNDGFLALRCLRVPHSTPKLVTRLLNALPLGRLQEFETADRINWENVQTASELREILKNWRTCFGALAHHVNLKTIVITINVDDDILEECEDIRFIDMIEPLLSIRGLEAFAVFSLADMPLSDADVYKMVTAWPRLTYIDFCFPTEDDQPSFLSLQHIATHSPFLESVLISLDSSVDVPVITPKKSHPLKEIRLGLTDVDDMPVLVQHLRSLFPKLEDIALYGDDEATAVMDAYRSMTVQNILTLPKTIFYNLLVIF